MKFEKTKTLNVLEVFYLHSLMSMIWSKILLHIDTPDYKNNGKLYIDDNNNDSFFFFLVYLQRVTMTWRFRWTAKKLLLPPLQVSIYLSIYLSFYLSIYLAFKKHPLLYDLQNHFSVKKSDQFFYPIFF